MTTNAALTAQAAKTDESSLREVVEALAPIERLAGSEGEREAAEWIRERLGATGIEARIDEEAYREASRASSPRSPPARPPRASPRFTGAGGLQARRAARPRRG